MRDLRKRVAKIICSHNINSGCTCDQCMEEGYEIADQIIDAVVPSVDEIREWLLENRLSYAPEEYLANSIRKWLIERSG